ncbi:10 kDa chaperonin 2, chloroplastic [Stylosanthes scabra]|uniref:10 kDa chaperonin 2, chloroplastic n=1 Tax=Stylosanthes scabra TaxID=79078 RepID=A0ABU6QIH3_9FABA|nr:10 kDa chaperonin 2, chloroplastic [Stylosanthes scabra]
MASTFITLPIPFLHSRPTSFSFSNKQFPVLKRNSLKVNALVSNKWEPTKVVPQADRVLIRLEQLPDKTTGGVLLPKSAVKFERYLLGEVLSVGAEAEQIKAGSKVDLGTDEKHCFCKASDLLAVVE